MAKKTKAKPAKKSNVIPLPILVKRYKKLGNIIAKRTK